MRRAGNGRVRGVRTNTLTGKPVARVFFGLALVLVCSPHVVGAQPDACPLPLPVREVHVAGVPLEVEIAATPAARSCGLSRRSSLPWSRGMLFVYPKSAYPNDMTLRFWMRDTRLPLSIAFVDHDGRIVSIQQMKPMQTEERYRAPEPVRYALEVNRGWFARHGVRVGDVLEMPDQ